MKNVKFYAAGSSSALEHAVRALGTSGCTVRAEAGPDITHLLLPVPSFDTDGQIKGAQVLEDILEKLSPDVTIVGGMLRHPALEGYATIDLLADPLYLAKNAEITAHCTLKHLLNRLPVTLPGQSVLVIGWGRIGKCLGFLLQKLGAAVTIAARKVADRAAAESLGFGSADSTMLEALDRYRVIINTVPASIISKAQAALCRPDCVKIDLATRKGIWGDDVLWARGLPGIDAPETSGALIAQSVIRLIQGKEQVL